MTRPTDKHGCFSSLVLLAVLGFAWISSSAAVEPQSEYKIKSAYLYNFSRLTQLPEQHFLDDDGYHLCIVGENPFGPHLAPLAARPVNGHPLSVDHIFNKKGLTGCEMLFISRSEERKLGAWLKRAATLKILTVSDIDGFAQRGGIIGLVTQGSRVKFEINHAAAQRCNITISAKLLELGKIIGNGHKKDAACQR